MNARRFFSAALLALQLGGLTAPFAEARLEVGSGPVVHVEAEGEGPCLPSHDHQVCVLCQHLAGAIDVGPSTPTFVAFVAAGGHQPLADATAPSADFNDPNPIRGPPIA